MATPLLTIDATALCAHGGRAVIAPSNTRVLANKKPVAVLPDVISIAGCPFTTPPGAPLPCVQAKFLVPAVRVKINGQPAVLVNTQALTTGTGPPVPLSIVPSQLRVLGT
jgi:hypothetical protein